MYVYMCVCVCVCVIVCSCVHVCGWYRYLRITFDRMERNGERLREWMGERDGSLIMHLYDEINTYKYISFSARKSYRKYSTSPR